MAGPSAGQAPVRSKRANPLVVLVLLVAAVAAMFLAWRSSRPPSRPEASPQMRQLQAQMGRYLKAHPEKVGPRAKQLLQRQGRRGPGGRAGAAQPRGAHGQGR